jgi:hypothetical protein
MADGNITKSQSSIFALSPITSLVVTCLLAATVSLSQAQSAPCGITQTPTADTKFYPPIAKAAHVSGQVILLARFDHEGNSTVSQILSGPAMLRPAAKTYIESSRGMPSAGSRECPIIVTFKLADATGCQMAPEPANPFIQIDPQHVFINGQVMMICDPAATITRKKRFGIF